MAARRLLIVMLVLLGISTLAAALVPPRALRDDGTGSTAATTTEPAETAAPNPVPAGTLLEAEIEVGGHDIPVVGTESQPVRVGDQLELSVTCHCRDLLEIPALGLVDAVAPDTPATFDLLPTQPGSYGIRLVEEGRVVARIEVEKAPG